MNEVFAELEAALVTMLFHHVNAHPSGLQGGLESIASQVLSQAAGGQPITAKLVLADSIPAVVAELPHTELGQAVATVIDGVAGGQTVQQAVAGAAIAGS